MRCSKAGSCLASATSIVCTFAPSLAATQPTGDPQGLSHTMTGGNVVVSPCGGGGDGQRGFEPMDTLVASLDDGIVVEALRHHRVLVATCCPTDFVLPADPVGKAIVASIGADFLPPARPTPGTLVATPCP